MKKRLRISKSELKTCDIAYLYDDGHCILVHRKRDKDAGTVSWSTVYENIGVECKFEKPGRLIIDPGALPFLTVADSIHVFPASIHRGSDATMTTGLPVERIELKNDMNGKRWYINSIPSLVCPDVYYNEITEKFNPDIFSWAGYKIKKMYIDK